MSNGIVKCPRCGCTQLASGQKGVSVGKAVAGGVLLGPLGLLFGLSGRRKVLVSCLACGHQWIPRPKVKIKGGCGCLLAVLAIMLVIGIVASTRAKSELDEADKLFDSGKKAEAVAKYKANMDFASDKARVFKRVVEYELAQGNQAEARKWIDTALDKKVDVTYDTEAGRKLAADVQKEREQKAIAAKQTKQKAERERATANDIHAGISFDGTQFQIENKDDFDWIDVKLEVNPGMFSSGYTYKARVLKAGESYTVGAMQFAKSDGERFNPFTHKPKSLQITCKKPGGGSGFYYGEWE